ncbi:MAG: YkgJ family cysteine cluster protein [Candidatus Bathyarchaeota archaeon]|nr:YkgJ family cysteine cluster protein [Candidatus Bathyarchaeota archaeon]
MLNFVPWRHIAKWQCIGCGNCCKLYSVVLNFPEWLKISQIFGAEKTVVGLNKLFIKRVDDGSCVFLCNLAGNYFCGLQNMKPVACKLWPFKILSEPKYGNPNQALFNYRGKKLFIYADTMCQGLRYGPPSWEFTSLVLQEFADLALGNCRVQRNTTRTLSNGVRRFNF